MIKSEFASTALLAQDVDEIRTGSRSAAAAAEARRSVRAYTNDEVSDATLTRLLSLAGRAPSAFNVQPWRWIVVRDPSLKVSLSAAAYGQKQLTSAPVVLALYSDMEDVMARLDEVVHPGLPPEKRQETIQMLQGNFGGMTPEARGVWGNTQANIALGYLLLLAKAEGLDTSPMLGFEPAKVKSLLDIPEHATITALVALGHGAEEGFVSHRHPVDAITTFR